MSREHVHRSNSRVTADLIRHSSRESTSSSQTTRSVRDISNPHHMAIYTLFAVCAVFLITMIPNAMISIILYVEYMLLGNSQLYCLLRTLDAPFKIIRLINYSINVVLYGLTGRRFRSELQILLQHWKKLCRTKVCKKELDPILTRPPKEHVLLQNLHRSSEKQKKTVEGKVSV